jgi:hypothetical protein
MTTTLKLAILSLQHGATQEHILYTVEERKMTIEEKQKLHQQIKDFDYNHFQRWMLRTFKSAERPEEKPVELVAIGFVFK